MKRNKFRPLSDHDYREIVKFMEHLQDKRDMPYEQFMRKYQEYMGLSDSELEKALRK